MADAAWWAWIPMVLVLFALWGFVAWIVVRLFDDRGRGPTAGNGRTPREILDARLASGEITREAYEELRAAIEAEHRVGVG